MKEHLHWTFLIVVLLGIVFCISGAQMIESTSEYGTQVGTFMMMTGFVAYVTSWVWILIQKSRSLWYLLLLPTHGIGVAILFNLRNRSVTNTHRIRARNKDNAN